MQRVSLTEEDTSDRVRWRHCGEWPKKELKEKEEEFKKKIQGNFLATLFISEGKLVEKH